MKSFLKSKKADDRSALFGDRSHKEEPQPVRTQPRQDPYAAQQPRYDQRYEPRYDHRQEPESEAQDYQEQTQEEEDEDVEGIKQEIRFVKQESLASTQNALRMANDAEAAGRNTLTQLGQQAESLSNAERSMDLSKLANRDAQIKARELKHLNRHLLAVKVNKPWGKTARIEADERRVQQQHEDDRHERDLREHTRKEAERRTDANLKAHAEAAARGNTRTRMGLAERSRYQFEANESDDDLEEQIDGNLDALAAVTGRLKGLAMATNQEVNRQNQQLDRLDRKGEELDTAIHMNTHRLKRINERG